MLSYACASPPPRRRGRRRPWKSPRPFPQTSSVRPYQRPRDRDDRHDHGGTALADRGNHRDGTGGPHRGRQGRGHLQPRQARSHLESCRLPQGLQSWLRGRRGRVRTGPKNDAKSRSRSTSTAAPTKMGTSCWWPSSTRNLAGLGAARAQGADRPGAQALRARLRLQGADHRNAAGSLARNREEHLHHARRSQRRLLRDRRRQAQVWSTSRGSSSPSTAPTAASPTRR